MNRDFKGIFIPREIWLDEFLSSNEKILWSEIYSLFDRDKGGCYASNEYLSKFMGVSPRRVQVMLAKLKRYNLLTEVGFNGKERVLRALLPKEDLKPTPTENRGAQKDTPNTSRGEENVTPAMKFSSPPIYKDDNKGYRKEKSQKPSPSAVASDLSFFLFEKMKSIHPKKTEPNFKQWTVDMERMIRIDNRTPDEIKKLIEYIYDEGKFWIANVQCPAKLRDKFDQITLQKLTTSSKKSKEKEVEKKISIFDENKKWVQPIHSMKFKHFKKISIYENNFSIRNGEEYSSVPYTATGLKEIVINKLRSWGYLEEFEKRQRAIA